MLKVEMLPYQRFIYSHLENAAAMDSVELSEMDIYGVMREIEPIIPEKSG